MERFIYENHHNIIQIFKEMINRIDCNFFIPELENFISEAKMEFDREELLEEDPTFFTNYEEKGQEGENDSYICSRIRQDSVEEFITYINRDAKILVSINETNQLIILFKMILKISDFIPSKV